MSEPNMSKKADNHYGVGGNSEEGTGMTRNTKATNYIFALLTLYFGGASFIWGLGGFLVAMLAMVLALIAWAIWWAIYAIVEAYDE